MERTALLLEVTGFFITGILVAVVQWEKVKPLSDRAKLFIIEFPTRLKTSYSKIAWVVSNPIRTHNSRVPPELKIWQAPIWMVKTIIYTLLIAPMLLIILSLLLITFYSVSLISRRLSGHMVITNMLIGVGVLAIFVGLILELVLVW